MNSNNVYFDWTLRMQPYIFAVTPEAKLRKNKVAHSFNVFSKTLNVWWRLVRDTQPAFVTQSTQASLNLLPGEELCQYELQCNITASPPTGTVFDNSLSFTTMADRWRGNLLAHRACVPPPFKAGYQAETFNAATGWSGWASKLS